MVMGTCSSETVLPGTSCIFVPYARVARNLLNLPVSLGLCFKENVPFVSDHLLADSYIGQEDSPEMQQVAQNKRRLSVISDGKFERSFTEEQAEKMPSEGPKPRVYTISGERPMLSEHENDSMELVVMKGAAHEECHHGHHAHGAGGSHGVRHCKAWPGGRQGSKECPNCTRLAAPSQQSIELEQHPPGEAGWHRKRLERMYSVDRVSGK